MAVLDLEQNRIVVRVVYDGLASAGKSTNLQQLCTFFTTMRRSELYVPKEENGRTLYFDWLQLEGGLVSGHKLRCQLLTVPGQRRLAARRAYLLGTADVIVFVCDSDPPTLSFTRDRLHQVLDDIRSGQSQAFALVVQANKQDVPGAMSTDTLREFLDLDGTPIVPARAHEGVGVRETAVVAIREAANRMQSLILEHGVDGFVGVAESGEELYRQMLREEEGREIWSLDMLLGGAGAGPAAVNAEAAEKEATLASVAIEDLPADVLPESGDSNEEDGEPPGESRVEIGPSPVVEAGPASTGNSEGQTAAEYDTAGHPPLPRPGSLSGFVWPAGRGREIIRQMDGLRPVLRTDLVARHGHADGSGKSDAFIFQVGDWCVKTSGRRRFTDGDEAHTALLSIARFKVMLRHLLVPDTAIALQRDDDRGYWLWTIAPWVRTLGSDLVDSARQGNEDVLSRALGDFAEAMTDSLLLASRREIVLDVHPSNFARVGDQLRYLDDDFGRGSRIPSIGYTLLRRFDEYAAHEKAVDHYLARLESELTTRLSRSDINQLDLEAAIGQTVVRSITAEAARIHLLNVLRPQRQSASTMAGAR